MEMKISCKWNGNFHDSDLLEWKMWSTSKGCLFKGNFQKICASICISISLICTSVHAMKNFTNLHIVVNCSISPQICEAGKSGQVTKFSNNS